MNHITMSFYYHCNDSLLIKTQEFYEKLLQSKDELIQSKDELIQSKDKLVQSRDEALKKVKIIISCYYLNHVTIISLQ